MYNKIALLDVQVNTRQFDLHDVDLLCVDNERHIIPGSYFKKNDVLYNHGTICAAIIRKYAPKTPIVNIAILEQDSLTCDVEKLMAALKWCTENEIHMIHLSAGTTNILDYVKLSSIEYDVNMKNTILIAAQNNNSKYTMPASLPNVIGVRKNIHYTSEQYKVMYNTIDGINIEASGLHTLQNKDIIFDTQNCNSYAAPYITAKIYNLMQNRNISEISVRDILELLQDDACSIDGTADLSKITVKYIHNQLKLCFDSINKQCFIREYTHMTGKMNPRNKLSDVPFVNLSLSLTDNDALISALASHLIQKDYYLAHITDMAEYSFGNHVLLYPNQIYKIEFCKMIAYIFSPDVILSTSNEKNEGFDIYVKYVQEQIAVIHNDQVLKLFRPNELKSCSKFIIEFMCAGIP